jgi:hypothetical protein
MEGEDGEKKDLSPGPLHISGTRSVLRCGWPLSGPILATGMNYV